jgi:hypothetical protein
MVRSGDLPGDVEMVPAASVMLKHLAGTVLTSPSGSLLHVGRRPHKVACTPRGVPRVLRPADLRIMPRITVPRRHPQPRELGLQTLQVRGHRGVNLIAAVACQAPRRTRTSTICGRHTRSVVMSIPRAVDLGGSLRCIRLDRRGCASDPTPQIVELVDQIEARHQPPNPAIASRNANSSCSLRSDTRFESVS